MVRINTTIEFSTDFLENYGISTEQQDIILENINPMRVSIENQLRIYIEQGLRELMGLHEELNIENIEIEKDEKWVEY